MSNEKVVREKMVGAAPTGPAPEGVSDDGKKPPRRILTTLGELGPMLPVGFNVGGVLVKDLSTRVWKTKDERELSKLKKPKMSMATYIGLVLGQMCSKFGPHEWQPDTKMAERQVGVAQGYMGDVFYAYMYLRTQVIGPELKMTITCPTDGCGNFSFMGDLNSTEVSRIDSLDQLDWFHDLRNPIEIRKQLVTKFRLRAPRWTTLVNNSKDDTMTMSMGKIMAVQGSVVGLNEDPSELALTDAEMDELSKYDLESIASRVNDEFVGPKMVVEGNCPKCERDFAAPIDWSYDRFFSTSSL